MKIVSKRSYIPIEAKVHNDIIQANLNVSVSEWNVLLLILTSFNQKKRIKESTWHQVNLVDYAELAGISREAAYEAVRVAGDSLLTKIVKLKNGRALKIVHLITGIEVVLADNTIKMSFHPDLLPYISELSSRYTRLDVEQSFKLKNIYVNRLYTLLTVDRWNPRSRLVEYAIEELYDKLAVPDSYRSFKEFNRLVLSRAVKEFKTMELCKVGIEQVKVGRRVGKIRFKVIWPEHDYEVQLTAYTRRVIKEKGVGEDIAGKGWDWREEGDGDGD